MKYSILIIHHYSPLSVMLTLNFHYMYKHTAGSYNINTIMFNLLLLPLSDFRSLLASCSSTLFYYTCSSISFPHYFSSNGSSMISIIWSSIAHHFVYRRLPPWLLLSIPTLLWLCPFIPILITSILKLTDNIYLPKRVYTFWTTVLPKWVYIFWTKMTFVIAHTFQNTSHHNSMYHVPT